MSEQSAREQWSGRWGFIMAAAGSAIGLGNIWRFPYLVGQNGGAAFVLVYLAITVLIGLPIMLAEFSVGRAAQKTPTAAFSAIKVNPVWGVIGWIATIGGGFLTLSFYNVVGGWTIKYTLESLAGLMEIASSGAGGDFYRHFIAQKHEVVVYQIIFMALTMLFVACGVGKGIERACKIMIPSLFIVIIVIIVRSLSLPGAEAGIEFYLKPDFHKLTKESFLAALGQSFFSLSLGLGIMMTYGSYVCKEERLPSAAVWTVSLDTLVAILAGFAVLPAVFAMGFEPGSDIGMTFLTLPAVFAKMPFGWFFAFMFFLLLFFAAITSSMSLMEVAVSFAMEKFNMKRVDAVWVMGAFIILLGGYSAISLSGDLKVFGKNFFDAMDYLCNNVLLPVGSLLLSIFVGWFWLEPACKELTNGKETGCLWLRGWVFSIRFLIPVALVIIFLNGIGVL